MTQAARETVARFWAKRATMTVFVVLLFMITTIPWAKGKGLLLGWALCSSIVGLSMNVLAGYAGQISLAHAVLMGSGAFTLGIMVTRGGVPWLLALPAAGIVTAVIALAIGFPALRIRGLHLAIATLGFQFVMNRVVFRQSFLTGGAAGVDVERPELLGVSMADDGVFLFVILSCLILIWILDRNLTRSKGGRAFFALRQDEQVASSFGIPVSRYKLLAFAISGFYAGIAGALYGTLLGDVTNELFDFVFSIEFLVFAVLGGLGSRAGTAAGAAVPVLTRSILDFLRFSGALLGGVLLVFTLLQYQGGLAGQGRELTHGAKLLRLRGPIFFSIFWGILAVTVAAAVGVPYLVWLGITPVYKITSLPLILIGLACAVVVSQQLQKLVTKAAMSVPDAAQKALIYALGAVGALTLSIGAVMAGHLVLYFAQVAADAGDPGLAVRIGAMFAIPLYGALVWDYRHEGRRLAKLAAAHQAAAANTQAASPDAIDAAAKRVSFRRPTVRPRYRGPLLEVSDLAMHFGGVRALDGVSMEVRQGELIGIMGPNGSGKTTMLNCISGFLTPTRGAVAFRGRSITTLAPHRRAELGIGRTFQNIGLVKSETVFDNFLIAQHLVCAYGPMEGMLRTGSVIAEERRLRVRAQAAIEMLGLDDIVGERISALPHGRAKLVELGCALVTGPEVLLLDEPAAGVSPQEADALGETLKTIAADFGVTIVMIEHHVPLMLNTCDYIYVLNFGQLLTHGEPAHVARHPDVIAAYLGTSGSEASRAASVRV